MAEDLRSIPAHMAFRALFGSIGFFCVHVIGTCALVSPCVCMKWVNQGTCRGVKERRREHCLCLCVIVYDEREQERELVEWAEESQMWRKNENEIEAATES